MSISEQIENSISDDLSIIIAAAGIGTRMQSEVPKQFMNLRGKPVIEWSVRCFVRLSFVKSLIVVLPENWLEKGRQILNPYASEIDLKFVSGGEKRQDSVFSGLLELGEKNIWVGVHDGARPGIRPEEVTILFETAKKFGNAVMAVPSIDTLVEVDNATITGEVDRLKVWGLQTPQIFPLKVLRDAFLRARKMSYGATDESGLVRKLGIPTHLHQGSRKNIKITCQEDFQILESILENEN